MNEGIIKQCKILGIKINLYSSDIFSGKGVRKYLGIPTIKFEDVPFKSIRETNKYLKTI